MSGLLHIFYAGKFSVGILFWIIFIEMLSRIKKEKYWVGNSLKKKICFEKPISFSIFVTLRFLVESRLYILKIKNLRIFFFFSFACFVRKYVILRVRGKTNVNVLFFCFDLNSIIFEETKQYHVFKGNLLEIKIVTNPKHIRISNYGTQCVSDVFEY